MVLKLLLISTFIFTCPHVFSMSKKRQMIIFRQAKKSFKKKDYKKTLNKLNKAFSLNSPKTPSGALQLAAFSYEKLGQLKKAQSTYRKLIRSKFKKHHQKILKSYKENGNADDLPDDIPKKLLLYYFRRTKIWLIFYKQNFDKFQYKKMLGLRNRIKTYLEILQESDFENEKALESFAEELRDFDRKKTDQLYKPSFFASIGHVSWKDVITLVDSQNVRADIKSTNVGMNLCGGYKIENAHVLYKGSLCWATTSADVGNKTSSFDYFQESVPVSMLSVMPSILWKPYKGDTALGLTFPIAYRKGDYTTPNNHTLENTTLFSYGYLATLIWIWKPVSIEVQFGKLKSFSSSFWGLNAIYDF